MANKQYHSSAYHRYFEDFAEQKNYDEKGRMHIKRIYVGNYYRRNVSDKHHKVLRFWYAVMYILALAAFLFAGTADTELNTVMYVYIPVVLSLVTMIYLIIPLFYSLTVPREMIIRMYRNSSEKLITTSICAAVLQVVNALATIIGLFFVSERFCLEHFLSIAGFLVSAGILFLLWKTEQHLEYEMLPAKNAPPPCTSVIRYRNIY